MWAAVQTVFLLRRTKFYYNGRGVVFDVTSWAHCVGLAVHLVPGEHLPSSPGGGGCGGAAHTPPPRGNRKKQNRNKRR